MLITEIDRNESTRKEQFGGECLQKKIPEIELIPQSITTAPGLIQSPFTNFGLPIATTKISASLI